MNEHTRRILAPKTNPNRDKDARIEWGQNHPFCQVCGAGNYGLTTHEIIGGRGGRSFDPCNMLRACMHPCHNLLERLDVRGDDGELLPKLTLAIQLSIKLRAGELDEEGLARLAVLHGRTLPEPEKIPELFQTLYRKRVRDEEAFCDVLQSWHVSSPKRRISDG